MVKVIGTGFGRTGTDSMREALNQIGFGPCHHMRELLADADHRQLWRDLKVARDTGGTAPEWDKILGKYGSCVDWPSAAYWPELIELYPDAKVLLTWRTPESWWASFEKTILPILLKELEAPDPAPGSDLLTTWVFGGRFDRDHCIATYKANVEKVHDTVPADRLLVYKIGDGWEPLCAFLGVPVPDTDFPRTNSTADFQTSVEEREAAQGQE